MRPTRTDNVLPPTEPSSSIELTRAVISGISTNASLTRREPPKLIPAARPVSDSVTLSVPVQLLCSRPIPGATKSLEPNDHLTSPVTARYCSSMMGLGTLKSCASTSTMSLRYPERLVPTCPNNTRPVCESERSPTLIRPDPNPSPPPMNTPLPSDCAVACPGRPSPTRATEIP